MRFHTIGKKVISSLLCIVLGICFTACAGQMGSEDASEVARAKKIDVSIPAKLL